MNYHPLEEPFIQQNESVKAYRAIIEKHKEYFKGKDLYNIIRVRWSVGHETGVLSTDPPVTSTLWIQIHVLRGQISDHQILSEMSSLSMPPIFVDAF